jgi:hypothetical protein
MQPVPFLVVKLATAAPVVGTAALFVSLREQYRRGRTTAAVNRYQCHYPPAAPHSFTTTTTTGRTGNRVVCGKPCAMQRIVLTLSMGLVVVWDHRWLLVKGAQDATDLVTLLYTALRFLRIGCASAISIPHTPRDLDTAHSARPSRAQRYRYRALRSTVPIPH